MPLRELQFLALLLALAFASAFVQYWKTGDAFLAGDSLYYAYTTESLLSDGDFDLTNQLMPSGNRADMKRHEGFFAASPDGKVVPKHSTLLPIVSLPFVVLFGVIGLLILNATMAALLVFGVSKLGGDTFAARVTALLFFVTSSWLLYCFNYSPDLFATLLIVWTYSSAKKQSWILTGLFAGLTVWAKVYTALFLLPLALVIIPFGIKATSKVITGTLPGIIAMLIINVVLYGGPLLTGYDRDARVVADGFITTEHYSRFNQPFLPGLFNVLFDPATGLLRTAPLWFLWPFGFYWTWRSREPYNRPFAAALATGAIINVLFFAKYDEWNASAGGNRFLFPAVALGAALTIPILMRYFGDKQKAPKDELLKSADSKCGQRDLIENRDDSSG